MKYLVCYFFVALSLLETNGSSIDNEYFSGFLPDNPKDSVPGKKAFGTLKISPLQILASEIPAAFEIFIGWDLSLQLQAGYIFPTDIIAHWLEKTGPGGGVVTKGPLNYRIIPYNNDAGVNLKFEFRKYFKPMVHSNHTPYQRFYLAPQITYKNCYYNNNTFLHDPSGIPVIQVESKDANIFGFGFMLGRQRCRDRFVSDWFGGVGFRSREIKTIIHEKYVYGPSVPLPIDQNTVNEHSSYFFINFSARFGFEL